MPIPTAGPSSIGDNNEVVTQSAKSGSDAILTVGGPTSDANANLVLKAKGTGSVKLGTNVAVPSTKINLTGSKSANAALTSVIAALVTLGFCTDSTS